MPHRVTFIPGDGTGPEIAEATRRVLEATGVELDWDVQEAGADVMERYGGNPLPDQVLESIKRNGVAIKGPITTPVGTGFRSVNVALRKSLDLYGQVRPCKSYPGVRSRYDTVDLVVIRENTEDLYAGIEFEEGTEEALELIEWVERARARRHPPRLGHLDQADLGRRHAPDRPVRLRLRAQERPQQGHGRPQGEHHEVHGRPLPPRRARGGGRERGRRVRGQDRGQPLDAARPAAGGVRRPRAAEPLRRHRLRPLRRADRRPRARPGRQLRHARGGLRADARLGAEVHGPEQGEPDGDDALRRDDAPPPGGARGGRPARGGDRRGDRRGQVRHLRHEADRDDPTAVGTSEVADAIIDRMGVRV